MGKRKRMTKKNKSKKKTAENLGEFWVEKIIDHGLLDDGSLVYLIKWENYPEEDNSWEVKENLGKCDEHIQYFLKNTVNGQYPVKYSWEEFDLFCKYMHKLIESDDLALMARLCNKTLKGLKQKNIKEMKETISGQIYRLESRPKLRTNSTRLEMVSVLKEVVKSLKINNNFGSITGFFEFIDGRPHVKKKLKQLEKQFNEVIKKEKEGKPIRISNEIDCEIPSLKGYVADYILDINIVKGTKKIEREDPLVSCKCDNCYDSRHECCTAVHGFPMVYNKNGRLHHNHRERDIIFECNSGCSCGPNCPNRQIQNGRQFEIEIFRTDSKVKGWGVRALQDIPQGSFITHYAGEVVSLNEAGKRPTTYLFDLGAHLDHRDIEYTYVVDASNYGNVARFVNHSCAPNCRSLFAWTERSANTLLPIIALFAIKNIRAYEEITYDYSMDVIDYYNEECNDFSDLESDSSSSESEDHNRREDSPLDGQTVCTKSVSSKRKVENGKRLDYQQIDCECGANNCKKFLYS